MCEFVPFTWQSSPFEQSPFVNAVEQEVEEEEEERFEPFEDEIVAKAELADCVAIGNTRQLLFTLCRRSDESVNEEFKAQFMMALVS